MKLVILFFLLFNFSIATKLDSLSLSKIKKTVQKEEEIAKAYKNFLINEGSVPTVDSLITAGYLPKGFSKINPFGKEMKISLTLDNTIVNSLPDSIKIDAYDHYYNGKYREYTREPLSSSSDNVKIYLSKKEKIIFDRIAEIDNTNPVSQYSLEDGVLNWYDANGNYKYSFDGEKIIVDESVTILNSLKAFSTEFKDMTSGVRHAGQTILQEDNGVVEDYLVTDDSAVALNETKRNYGGTIIQFTRRAGGMIVNGDIYTWGNNQNRITSINSDNLTGDRSDTAPVINALVRAKVHVPSQTVDGLDYSRIINKGYFSSPMRPRFIDFHATVYSSTCGVTTKGELFCGGTTGKDKSFGTMFTHVDKEGNDDEMLYRSTFFNGSATAPKAKKVFSNNQIWHILSEEGDIYRWGYDFSGFAGDGQRYWNYGYYRNEYKNPEIIPNTGAKFDDITYLLTIGYRKIGALSTTGDIYIWGVETQNSNNYDCTERWEYVSYNLCFPTAVTTSNSTMSEDLTFTSIKGGLEAFIAEDTNGNYYKIYHPKNKKIQVESLNEAIKTYSEYDEQADSTILSIDLSSKLSGSSLEINKGIVWVNGNNELKGDYFTSENKNDNLFKSAISKIKWKKIKVIQDDNGMCGIDVNNQMYCWGVMSFYRNDSSVYSTMGNTFMIPVFNSNLYDLDKDFLVAEGGNGYLTNMTSDEWETTNSDGYSGAFFMKYPTYIGGFNFEFEFK
jgi:hypothetical protein